MTEDYLSLVTSKHRDKPLFAAVITALTASFSEGQAFAASIPDAFSVDNAVGVQLDVVGELVGVPRDIIIPVDNTFFSWGVAGKGWGDGTWRGPFDESYGQVQLDDTTYRRLIKARILANKWDGTIEQAKAIIQAFFGIVETIIYVNENAPPEPYTQLFSWGIAGKGWGAGTWSAPRLDEGFNLTYNSASRVFIEDRAQARPYETRFCWGTPGKGWGEANWEPNTESDTPTALGFTISISGVTPRMIEMQVLASGALGLKPAGIPVNYRITSVPDAPIFGFGANNEFIGGWGRGAWGLPIDTALNA